MGRIGVRHLSAHRLRLVILTVAFVVFRYFGVYHV